MSKRKNSLEHVLTRMEQIAPALEEMNSGELKRAARFWFGSKASSKMPKAECSHALAELFRQPARVEVGVRSLPDKQQQVLAIFQRYGGALSGPLLLTELLARGLVEKIDRQVPYYGRPRTEDPVQELCAKLLLISPSEGDDNRYGTFASSYRRSYPTLFLHPALRDLVEPAAPLPWKPSVPPSRPTVTYQRWPAEVALDLWSVAQALGQAGSWKTNRGGALAKSMQVRLHKLVPGDEHDPLLPPASESLYYEILRGLGAVRVKDCEGCINLGVVERQLRSSEEVQGWHWVRAWMQARLWQDGIGVVPDRDSYQDASRIEPHALATARELLVWALSRVASAGDDWLDLETFLIDLWSATDEETIDFYWYGYTWKPDFASARNKEEIHDIAPRRQAFWLADEGTWAANALLGTLVYLGLVERGSKGANPDRHPCFRLTRLGQAVFGAPELSLAAPERDPRFLTIQPNHEVLAYLDSADASAIWPLAQMARRTSAAGERVQTFTLTRDSVYQALESGLTLETIQRFLTEHSRTGLPANVAQSLAEWGRRREALVLRTDAALAAFPSDKGSLFPGSAKARPIGDHFLLLARTASHGPKGCLVRDHRTFAEPLWEVDEECRVNVTGNADAVALTRLRQFAEPCPREWRITADSIRRARDRGISAEQVLGWLQDHVVNELPPLLETAIRNWSSPARVFLGQLLMLQVTQPQACAMIRDSRRFRPFLVGHVPPDWFLVNPDKRKELEQLLKELGFSAGGSYQLTEGMKDDREEVGPRKADAGRPSRKDRQVGGDP